MKSYFGLRSYTDGGEHYDGQIGSEATPAAYVAALVECTRECRLAKWRTADPGERAKALGVPKPPPVPDGQEPLFADI